MQIVRPDPTVSADLGLLEQEAQSLSKQRALVQARIDHLYLSSPLDDEQMVRLDELEEIEVGLSLDRRSLHRRIDKLRGELGLPAVGEARELDESLSRSD